MSKNAFEAVMITVKGLIGLVMIFCTFLVMAAISLIVYLAQVSTTVEEPEVVTTVIEAPTTIVEPNLTFMTAPQTTETTTAQSNGCETVEIEINEEESLEALFNEPSLEQLFEKK